MPKQVLTCRLCGQQKKLIKAHIIPRQFYRRLMEKTPNLLKFEVGNVLNKKITQSGIHEKGLLCAECDNKIGDYDKYGYEVLSAETELKKINSLFGGEGKIYEIGQIDMELFRLFLVSLAWRAGIAEDPMFQLVKIGDYEDRLKQVLLGKTVELLDTVTAVIVLFLPPKYPQIMWSPFSSKMDGINIVTFYLPPWKLLLKLDQRPFNEPFDKLALSPGKPALAYVQDFWSTDELNLLMEFHQRSRKAAGLD